MQSQQTSRSDDVSGATYGKDAPALSVRGGKVFAIYRMSSAKAHLPSPKRSQGTH